jgi:hypothetical protein
MAGWAAELSSPPPLSYIPLTLPFCEPSRLCASRFLAAVRNLRHYAIVLHNYRWEQAIVAPPKQLARAVVAMVADRKVRVGAVGSASGQAGGDVHIHTAAASPHDEL